jgi:hypothetical protein
MLLGRPDRIGLALQSDLVKLFQRASNRGPNLCQGATSSASNSNAAKSNCRVFMAGTLHWAFELSLRMLKLLDIAKAHNLPVQWRKFLESAADRLGNFSPPRQLRMERQAYRGIVATSGQFRMRCHVPSKCVIGVKPVVVASRKIDAAIPQWCSN